MDAVRRVRALSIALLASCAVFATPNTGWCFGDVSFLPVDDYSQRWSLAITGRTQLSPYEDQDLHSDLIPLIAYTGETVFLAGTKAGLHLFKNDDWRANLFVAYRFAGYNDEDNDVIGDMKRENGVDGGFDITRITSIGDFTFDATSDISSASNGQVLSLYWSRYYEHGDWKVLPWVGVSWYSADFNRFYYGVERNEVTAERPLYYADESTSFRIGSDIRYRMDKIQSLTFNIEYERLAATVYDSPIVDEQDILKLGINYRMEISDEEIKPTGRGYDFLTSKRRPWSYRIAGGTNTDVKLNEILRTHIEFDDTQPKLLSFFAGKQITRTFFASNWEAWANLGIARRFEKNYQDDFFEYVGAIKFFYSNFPWSKYVLTRFGVAEGISYAERIPVYETEIIDPSNDGNSHLLNYLDFSFDANLGDLLNANSIKHCFGGFSVHHRSGIFESADLFGPVYGGSNVNTLYMECLYN